MMSSPITAAVGPTHDRTLRRSIREHSAVTSAGSSKGDPHQSVGDATMASDDLAILQMLTEETVRAYGEAFFQSLVRTLSKTIDAHYAFVAEFAGSQERVRTLAYWANDRIEPNIEWDLKGTPCEDVILGEFCHHPTGVRVKFPKDRPLVEMRIESYMGVPLLDVNGKVMGHLAIFDERPMPAEPRRLSVFRLLATRAAAELERLQMERALEQSVRRYRDLFEEAPIGYVYEDTSTRFVSANHAAQQILGLKPEEVVGTVGMDLVAPTPANQERVRQSLAAEAAGKQLPFILLELRRKDNGKSVWIQRHSRPEPHGKYTRTMLVDITAQVLAEQERNRLRVQNSYLQEEIKASHNFEEIVGQSESMRKMFSQVQLVAPTDAAVLILGETGTGKELVARAIHSTSTRRNGPMIKVNCAALPTGLVESELFGHEKGAFTGATEKRIGRFELADGGTLFLDEIGELPADVQVRLLRVLQEHEFERVGGTRTIKVNVRVIAATNRDLQAEVAKGSFRQDLFYRLNVFPIHMPALRDRAGDITLLVHFFVKRFAPRIGRPIEGVGEKTMQRLAAYTWPGNVRELENVIERAVILSPGPMLEVAPELLPRVAKPSPTSHTAAPASMENVERDHMVRTLEGTGWVIDGQRGAAVLLNMHPNTLRSRMKKLGITRPTHDPS